MKISEFKCKYEDIIYCDGYLEFCKKNEIPYIKTDFFYTGPMIWRGESHPQILGEICVVGHSDYPIVDQISSKFKLIFGMNKFGNNKNSFGIPIGMCNDTDESPLHRIYGNKEMILEVSNTDLEKSSLCYMNFNESTSPSERTVVKKMFSEVPWVLVGLNENTFDGRREYLLDIKKSKFVLCPRGNGVDTHRIWETLYMGSIPIVKYESSHELFTDLPILFINQWEEVTEEYLVKKYDEIVNKDWNLEKLKIGYWFNFISSKIKEFT